MAAEKSFEDADLCYNQKKLPKLPVPELSQTLATYLEYARVLAGGREKYERTKEIVNKFEKEEGPVLQEKLEAMAETSENWANVFWLPDMYLASRLPLPVYSNPAYVFPDKEFANLEDLCRYASHFIRGVYEYKEKLDKRAIPVDRSTGKDGGKPLCMEQYWRLFTSYRRPDSPLDSLDTATNLALNDGNEHVIVACNNQFFKVQTAVRGEQLNQLEINSQLLRIFEILDKQTEKAIPIGLLTACDRDKAAEARRILEKDATNLANLIAIKTATFLFCFDKPSPTSNSQMDNSEAHMAVRAMHMLHGNGVSYNTANRWFNKTIQFIFSVDGACGMNYEHSVGEALAVINPVEAALKYADSKLVQKVIGSPRMNLEPKPLVWNISDDIYSLVEGCKEKVDRLVNDLDFVLLDYRGFGREFPKSKRISPDAFIQVVLQLTYYRCHGHLVSTYESAMLRRFRHGRVDNIRAATPEVLTWVTVMDDPNKSQDHKLAAFRSAIDKHSRVMEQNLTGRGIDNHLVALCELAKQNLQSLPAMFTDTLFDELFRFPLSTSQVQTRLPGTFMCYGPVVDDGYGCGYNPRADQIQFMISSLRSCPLTDSTKFRNTLEKTLNDMKDFVQ